MKNVLLPIFAVIIAIGVSTLIVFLINRKHKIKNYLKAIIIPLSSLILITAFTLTYFAINYPASKNAKSYLKSDDVINLNINQHWYHFDNKEKDGTAIVFYSGAKVDPVSYSPLCNLIAHQGVDVYLMKMPLYFPLLNVNAANKVAALDKYNNLYMMGHSLGATTASLYINNTKNNSFKGIIFLASYPNKKMDDSYKCLSIYGSNDSVLNKKEYNQNAKYLPSSYKEVVIEGGNHSYFGDYGMQRRDGKASITREEQINITKNEVINFVS